MFLPKGTVVQPDIMVICDKDKIKQDGCHGAPDFIIEILSTSTGDKDKGPKFYKYFSSGVKEYWLVDPDEEIIYTYKFNRNEKQSERKSFAFNDKFKSRVFDGLEIDFSQLDLEFE